MTEWEALQRLADWVRDYAMSEAWDAYPQALIDAENVLMAGRAPRWRCRYCGMDVDDPEHRSWACEAKAREVLGDTAFDDSEAPA